VYDAELVSAERAKEIVPSLSDEVRGGFWVPRDAVIDVFEMVYASMQNAMENGVKLLLNTAVKDIQLENGRIQRVLTDNGYEIETSYIVNCAGCFASGISRMVGVDDYSNVAKAGEIYILDKNLPYAPSCLVNPLPKPESRGILIVPTVHGNTLLGPNVEYRDDVEDTATTRAGLEQVLKSVQRRIPQISAADSVTQFTGVRPTSDPGGWKMRAIPEVKGYLEAVGITGAFGAGPAIAVTMRELLIENGLKLKKKKNWDPVRVGIRRFNQMSQKERNEYVARDPLYGHIICRCETVTEAEIVEAIHRVPPAQTLDAIKRRVRAGMGRCQAGFCSPRVVEILAREMKVPIETICKNEPGSEIVVRRNRMERKDENA
jgi:glycerol-3-phosphate dehydrogenase